MVVRDFPVPRSGTWLAAARARLDSALPGPPVRGAATVLLVRDGDRGPEVFMLRRVPSMEFAPRVHVFPGGGVDPEDSTVALADADLAPLAARMRLPASRAAPLVACALRELEEEAGVLVGAGDLSVRGHWITPPLEKRRYDTWFFAARLPAGQDAVGLTSESDQARWVRPRAVLDEYAAGSALLLPPTVVMLEQVAAARDVEAYLGSEPAIAAVMPELVETATGFVMRAHLP